MISPPALVEFHGALCCTFLCDVIIVVLILTQTTTFSFFMNPLSQSFRKTTDLWQLFSSVSQFSIVFSFPQYAQVLTGRLAIVSNLISRGRIVLRIEKASKWLGKKTLSNPGLILFQPSIDAKKILAKKMWSSIQAKPRLSFWTLLLCSRSLLLEPRGSGPVGHECVSYVSHRSKQGKERWTTTHVVQR